MSCAGAISGRAQFGAMNAARRWTLLGLALGVALAFAGAWWLAYARLQQMHAAFDTDGRIIHRLLSQRATADEAVLATLALVQPGEGASAQVADARLPALYPQVQAVWSRAEGGAWPAALRSDWAAAEQRSRVTGHAELAAPDLASGRYGVVLATERGAYALLINLKAAAVFDDWPVNPAASPVRVLLEHGGQSYLVEPGQVRPDAAWTFIFRKPLASASQPLEVVAERSVTWDELPWGRMALWCLIVALAWGVIWRLARARVTHRRTRELLQLGQVGRLNALGELAAGMAHELNQPLTAVLANTQAARRLLAEEPPEMATARTAMDNAAAQARRAADTLARLRRLVERPAQDAAVQVVAPAEAVRDALRLLDPDCRRLGVAVRQELAGTPSVLADPVALQQILHNLLTNALQALGQAPASGRVLRVFGDVATDGRSVALHVADTGGGIPPALQAHLFEPFTSSKPGGLGLGLTLCESLAGSMGGSLVLQESTGAGTTFVLTLPCAPTGGEDA